MIKARGELLHLNYKRYDDALCSLCNSRKSEGYGSQCLEKTLMQKCKLTESELKALAEKGYDIQSIINEGSYSVVYFGEYFHKDKSGKEAPFPKDVPVKIACKVMQTKSENKDFTEKFLPREMTIHSRISHPHIIFLHGILQVDTKVLLIMRYAERGTLCHHIQMYGELGEHQARLWFRQITVALAYLHTMNIAHRDVKCENILITCNNNVKLADFGFSRQCLNTKGRFVYSETFCGSFAYAAPELLKGIPYNAKIADIWALGVVMFVMLNGCFPFDTENYIGLFKNQLNRNFKYRTKVLMRISYQAVNLTEQLLTPNWFKRPNAEEVLKSEWIALEPNLTELTPLEKTALENIEHFTMKKKIKVKKDVIF